MNYLLIFNKYSLKTQNCDRCMEHEREAVQSAKSPCLIPASLSGYFLRLPSPLWIGGRRFLGSRFNIILQSGSRLHKFRQGRISPCNPVQLLLHLAHFIPPGANVQVFPGPGSRDAGNFLRLIDIHVASIIVAQNLNRAVILVSQVLRAPLAQPIRAGNPLAIAILGQDGLFHVRPGQIIAEHLIDYPGNAFKIIPPIYPFMVVCRGRGNRKIIAFVAVPLRSC